MTQEELNKEMNKAIHDRNTQAIGILVKLGADVNICDKLDRTPLHLAAIHGEVEIVRMLIDAGAYVDVQDEDGWTALQWAARYGKVEIVQMLIDAGANRI
jgi:serine/threonine-protein phosphatase 6 regulatory ankyrin repeat subunit C